jgi:hypothetical protein
MRAQSPSESPDRSAGWPEHARGGSQGGSYPLEPPEVQGLWGATSPCLRLEAVDVTNVVLVATVVWALAVVMSRGLRRRGHMR